MTPAAIGPVADLIKAAISRIWPDPAQQAEANYKLAQLVQSGELAAMTNETSLALAQLGINKAEAESGSFFRGGWRPYVGWVCGHALAWNYILRPMVQTAARLLDNPVELPPAELAELLPVLFALLGMGGYRTLERKWGKA